MVARLIERPRRDTLGEGPLWSARDHAVYWVDILGQYVNRLSLTDDQVTSWPMPQMIGWVIERANRPGFIAGLKSGFSELTLDPVQVRPIVSPESDVPGNRMNDAKADRWGRIWAGTMPIKADVPTGALYRLDADHSVSVVDRGYIIANGPAFSPAQDRLYHTDSGRKIVYRFDIHDDGSLGERSEFVRFENDWGSPDGMTVDEEGSLWIAHWGVGRVSRFDAQGRVTRAIELPTAQVSSCTFAGPNLDRMFVTTAAVDNEQDPLAGGFFEVDPGVKGLAPGRFAG